MLAASKNESEDTEEAQAFVFATKESSALAKERKLLHTLAIAEILESADAATTQTSTLRFTLKTRTTSKRNAETKTKMPLKLKLTAMKETPSASDDTSESSR